MISFKCDYLEGAHPEVLRRLQESNNEQLEGYGVDHYCKNAKQKILKACGCPTGEVYFLEGGTQTNATVIASLLSDYEAVVCAETGHINEHEAGAIEYTGHKVITLKAQNGKINGNDLENYLATFEQQKDSVHTVIPGLLYISLPTEYGTIYTRSEMKQLREVTQRHGISLYIDGARLGYALACKELDYGLADLKNLCDVFYIGGTKVGALCGEAVVFPHATPKHFGTIVKQHGALLAKGRLLGIQFDTLFTNDLYIKISQNAIARAEELKAVLRDKGYQFYVSSPTNQQFVIMSDTEIERLQGKVGFDVWQRYDEHHRIVRWATSWATTREQVQALRNL